MERKDVVQALETALTDVLERPVTGLRGEIRLFDDLHLDSTTMLEMLMALEDSIGLVVDPEELDVDDFESVDTFTDFVLSGPLAPSPSPAAVSSSAPTFAA
ncbi:MULTISPECIES: phosphopantetheine-binding protein [Streptomyces]|uniref:Acyl carrier protein n=2 Tax=Streptomyces TaxID=1883 RepID=A0A6G3SUJ2_STRAQ|nr:MULTISPECIES: phosphopantetheine-binding protein [Streptomyces]NEE17949.1 acyl carrier protein [Streptomyces sp. SID7499]NDZ62000.1 acyl carrier protein [Streptomyces anulatus]NEB86540.1 acyl carrier protein [Streptomyces anulatus]NEC01237.1 acyl carrier protein [Streptomyces anulatus]NED28550.1 acyl carrier protein [Streptomyces anulatus]